MNVNTRGFFGQVLFRLRERVGKLRHHHAVLPSDGQEMGLDVPNLPMPIASMRLRYVIEREAVVVLVAKFRANDSKIFDQTEPFEVKLVAFFL